MEPRPERRGDGKQSAIELYLAAAKRATLTVWPPTDMATHTPLHPCAHTIRREEKAGAIKEHRKNKREMNECGHGR